MNNVNCQFTFGVFTKWDECKRKEKEKKSEDTVDVDQLREVYEQDFLNALKGECEMFFVNVECENTNDVSLLFLLFFSMLHAFCFLCTHNFHCQDYVSWFLSTIKSNLFISVHRPRASSLDFKLKGKTRCK